jgi:hypothetical protein
MREVIVRFEDAPGPAGAVDSVVCGAVLLAGGNQGPFRFDGWLQLLGLLEELSARTGEHPRKAGR